MDIVDILKDLVSPRSMLSLAGRTTTPTSSSSSRGVGGLSSFHNDDDNNDDDEEDSTIVQLLPSGPEDVGSIYRDDHDDNDSSRQREEKKNVVASEEIKEEDDDQSSTMIQYLPGTDIDDDKENFATRHSHHYNTFHTLQKFAKHNRRNQQSLLPTPNSQHTTTTTTTSTTTTTTTTTTTPAAVTMTSLHTFYQRHPTPQTSQQYPSLLSCSEDDTEEDEADYFDDINFNDDEEDSTVVQTLPGKDDATHATAAAMLAKTAIDTGKTITSTTSPLTTTMAATTTFQQCLSLQGRTNSSNNGGNGNNSSSRRSILQSNSLNRSDRLPPREVYTKTRKNPKPNDIQIDNGSHRGNNAGVEIVDVITEHFAFTPQIADSILPSTSSFNKSDSMPLREVYTSTKKNPKTNGIPIDNGSHRVNSGVEIVDVITEHFAFTPPRITEEGAKITSKVATTEYDMNSVVLVDDESTVIQFLPGMDFNNNYDDDDDDENCSVVFTDERTNRSTKMKRKNKNGELPSNSSSMKKKVFTTAAVFVMLTVCLGVGYKAGNLMTAKSSSSSSSSSTVAMTAITLEDCLALHNATNYHVKGSRDSRQRYQKKIRRRELEENDWKKILMKCDELLASQGTQEEHSNSIGGDTSSSGGIDMSISSSSNSTTTSTTTTNTTTVSSSSNSSNDNTIGNDHDSSEATNAENITIYTIFKSKALKKGKSSKIMVNEQIINSATEQPQYRGSKTFKSPPSTTTTTVGAPTSSSSNITSSPSQDDIVPRTPSNDIDQVVVVKQETRSNNTSSPATSTPKPSTTSTTLTPSHHCPSVGRDCKGPKDCCKGEKCCQNTCIDSSSLIGNDATCV